MFNLPIGINIDHLIDDLRTLSWEAADIFNYYSMAIENDRVSYDFIQNKENNDPVTLADLRVNELIIQRFRERYKNAHWDLLSEENGLIRFHNDVGVADWLWVLDPLDGTKDFIQKTSNYALHLALNYKNRPFIGVVLIPAREELWISNQNMTWCENKNKIEKKVKLSDTKNIEDMIVVTSKNHKNKMLNEIINIVGFKESIVMGSIGCKVASILRGESDIFISLSLPGQSSPKDWDFAAPESLLKSAGGAITNIENQELIYNSPHYRQEGLIIASNDISNHKIICEQIKKIIMENMMYPF